MLRALAERLQLLVTPHSPFSQPIKLSKPAPITWVRPEIVCTVRFHSWTPDGRLRAPVFLGLRPDIDPAECVRGGASEASDVTEPRGADEPPAWPEGPASTESSFLAGKAATVMADIDRRQLKFTNLNKVFYPQEGYTKRDVIRYYDAVAPLLLPYLQNRPLSLRRYPDGIEGESFFQKHARTDFPSWLRTETIEMHDGKKPTRFVVADDRASLLYLANLACIDQNPWMSRALAGRPDSLEHPDFILIDLDPQDCPYDCIVEAAQMIRQKLELVRLEGYPKTTGGHGMHIYVPVEPVYTYEQTRTFAEILARWVAEERPDLFTTPRPVARREKGKVYFDYLQNGYGKTISAPYVLRAHPGAPVATPLAWHEVQPGLVPTRFHIRNALDRFASVGDLFRPVLNSPQRIEPALEKLAGHMKQQ
jgi:bifunctional non-homologous end joining protein LigD